MNQSITTEEYVVLKRLISGDVSSWEAFNPAGKAIIETLHTKGLIKKHRRGSYEIIPESYLALLDFEKTDDGPGQVGAGDYLLDAQERPETRSNPARLVMVAAVAVVIGILLQSNFDVLGSFFAAIRSVFR